MSLPDSTFEAAASRIRSFLEKHPQIALIEKQGSLTVEPGDDDGFELTLQDNGNEVILFAGPYHTHVDDPEEAAACFMWMLTPAYRIVEELRNGSTKKAKLERFENGEWQNLGTFGVLLPMFGKKELRIHQNRTLPDPR